MYLYTTLALEYSVKQSNKEEITTDSCWLCKKSVDNVGSWQYRRGSS